MTRAGYGSGEFSLDGCKTKADVDARREFLRHASRHQVKAHRFSDEDLCALVGAGREVQRVRLNDVRRRFFRRTTPRSLPWSV